MKLLLAGFYVWSFHKIFYMNRKTLYATKNMLNLILKVFTTPVHQTIDKKFFAHLYCYVAGQYILYTKACFFSKAVSTVLFLRRARTFAIYGKRWCVSAGRIWDFCTIAHSLTKHTYTYYALHVYITKKCQTFVCDGDDDNDKSRVTFGLFYTKTMLLARI